MHAGDGSAEDRRPLLVRCRPAFDDEPDEERAADQITGEVDIERRRKLAAFDRSLDGPRQRVGVGRHHAPADLGQTLISALGLEHRQQQRAHAALDRPGEPLGDLLEIAEQAAGVRGRKLGDE